jgi:hypothetical protein
MNRPCSSRGLSDQSGRPLKFFFAGTADKSEVVVSTSDCVAGEGESLFAISAITWFAVGGEYTVTAGGPRFSPPIWSVNHLDPRRSLFGNASLHGGLPCRPSARGHLDSVLAAEITPLASDGADFVGVIGPRRPIALTAGEYPALNKITSASFAKSTWVNIVLSNQTKVTWSRALSALSRDFCTTRHKSGSSCRSLGHHDRLRFGSFGHRRSHARATLGTYPASGGQSFAQKAKGEESALSF